VGVWGLFMRGRFLRPPQDQLQMWAARAIPSASSGGHLPALEHQGLQFLGRP
jgi:hypothetical protein